jgi:hypothetical protein
MDPRLNVSSERGEYDRPLVAIRRFAGDIMSPLRSTIMGMAVYGMLEVGTAPRVQKLLDAVAHTLLVGVVQFHR